MGWVSKAEVILYHNGGFWTVQVGTGVRLQLAASPSFVINTSSVRSRNGSTQQRVHLRAVEGAQEPVLCAVSVVSIQQEWVLYSTSGRSERTAVCIQSTFWDLWAEFPKLKWVLYRKGEFYTATVGTKDLQQCAATPRQMMHRWSVQGRIGFFYCRECISRAVEGAQEPLQCAVSVVSIQQE